MHEQVISCCSEIKNVYISDFILGDGLILFFFLWKILFFFISTLKISEKLLSSICFSHRFLPLFEMDSLKLEALIFFFK